MPAISAPDGTSLYFEQTGSGEPVLVLVGDEDHPCLDGSLFLKRTVPTAALHIVPRAGHTITMEEPAVVNAALQTLFTAATDGTWMTHRKSENT